MFVEWAGIRSYYGRRSEKRIMRRHARTIVGLLALLAGASLLPLSPVAPLAAAQDGPLAAGPPLTDEQVQALVQRVLDNQRRDDLAIREYDRTERWFTRGNGKDVQDRDLLSRIIPTATGQVRVQLENNGKPTDPAELAKQWANAEQALINSSHPPSQRSKDDADRAAKRRQEEEDTVQIIGKAFHFHFVGRKFENGRAIVELSFEPNPSFKSSLRFAFVFVHTRGTVWVDEPNAQLVRLLAVLSDDVTYAAGLIAKVYRGGRLTYTQEEVAPGVWLPTHTTFDFDGKKFVFGNLSLHQRIDATDYRHMGPPDEALALVRHEHPSISLTDP